MNETRLAVLSSAIPGGGLWMVTDGHNIEYFSDRVEALDYANRMVREERALEQAEAELRAFEKRIRGL